MRPDRPAIFLDRDGTLVRDYRHAADPEKLELLPGVRESLSMLQRAGFKLVVVTNQSGIARGYFTSHAARAMGDRLAQMLGDDGIEIDGYYFCPHHEEGVVDEYAHRCTCRKPAPGLLRRASGELGLTLSVSWVIGDSVSDMYAGQSAGCRSILVDIGQLSHPVLPTGSLVARNIAHAARLILATDRFIVNVHPDPLLPGDLDRPVYRDIRGQGEASIFPSADHGRQALNDAAVLDELVAEYAGRAKV